MVGGYIVGYIALFIRKNLKVPHWAEALMPMMIIPTLSAILGGLLMYFVIGTPIVWATEALTNFITGLDKSAKFCMASSSVHLAVSTSVDLSVKYLT